jgi:hypothetical protein
MNRRTFINNSVLAGTGIAMATPLLSCDSAKQPVAFIDRILPAPIDGGYQDPDYWVWGSSVIKGEDGKYHMFASRWLKKLGFGKWVTNSEVVHAVADTPVGPIQKHCEAALPMYVVKNIGMACVHIIQRS